MHLYLVRHGAAIGADGRCIGHSDIALSPEGAQAIDRAGAALPRRPDRLVASDLARASRSADVLARRWRLPVTHDARLREMHFGEWDGQPWADIERHDGERLASWMADWVHTRIPGGESFADVVARMQDWLREAQAAWPDETVVAVAHAGAIRAGLCLWLALPPDQAFEFRLDPASVTALATAEPDQRIGDILAG